ncbi:MAG TPA: hypothetical protein VKB88_45180 [Bryobacteraceae bacterium]|nr:hypothetical protein [Bryobacteraceae bacterium]
MTGLFDYFQIHLVNYGPLPDHDALFNEVRRRITIHAPSEDNDGLGVSLQSVMEEVKPAAVILGETPLRGNMWLSHRLAASFGIRQVCIENYYGSFVETYLPAAWPDIHSWLFIGLPAPGELAMASNRIRTLPPLIGVPPLPPVRNRVCVLGYDETTLLTAVKLLESWDGDVDYIIAPAWRDLVGNNPGRVLELPSDDAVRECLAAAKLVIGKAGFQQIVEAIVFSVPIVCRIGGGTVTEEFLPDCLKPFVRFVHDDSEVPALRRILPAWLESLPPNAWAAAAQSIPDPAAHASNVLREMIAPAADDGNGAAAVESELRPWAASPPVEVLETLLSLVERRDWQALETALERVHICVQDTTLSSQEFIRELSSRIRAGGQVKSVILDKLSAGMFRCCIMVLEPDSWRKREAEFTIHLGFGTVEPSVLATIALQTA